MKIGAQDAEIQKALESVGLKSRSLDADLKKLGNTPLAKQAQESLDGLQKTFKSITDAQQRFADRARLTAQGLNAIGGPARLTRTELDAVAKTVEKGLDAFRALGQKAPEELKKVSQAIKSQQALLSGNGGGFFSNLFGDAGAEVTKIAVGFASGTALVQGFERAVKSVVGVVTDAVAAAGHLQDLTTSTKISTDALQGLGFAGKRVGLDLDTIVGIVDQLARRVGSGDAGAVGALQSLGLNINELKQLRPEELFEKVGLAASRIENPISRAGIASQLFGKQFEGALRIASDGLQNNIEEARRMGAILGPDAIKTLDDFGDHVGDLEERFKVLAAQALTPVVDLLDKFLLAGQELANRKPIKFLDPDQQKLFEAQLKLQERLDAERKAKESTPAAISKKAGIDLGQFGGVTIAGQNARNLAAGAAVITQADLIANRLKALRSAALEPLDATQRQNIETLSKWGEQEKEIADLVGASQTRVHLYLEELRKNDTEQKKFAEAQKEVQSALGGFGATLAGIDPLTVGFANKLLDLGVSEGKVATFLHLTDAELNVIKQKRALDAKLIELQAGANESLASALDKVGKKDVETIANLNNVLDLRKKLSEIEAPLKSFGNGPATPASVLEGLGKKDVTTIGELEERFKKMTEREKEADEALSAIVHDFALLAQIGGRSFGPLLQGIGSVVGGLKTMRDGLKSITTSKSLFGKIAGAAGIVGAGIEIGAALVSGINQAFENLELGRIGHDIGRDLGVAISDGTAQAIRDSEKKLRDAQIVALENAGIPEAVAKLMSQSKSFRGVATALNLPKIIQDAGGIDAFGADKAISQLHDLFSLVDQGKLSVKQIGEEFEDVFSQLVPNAISKTSKLASAQFVELQQTALRFGVTSPSLEKFRSEQIGGVQGGLSSFFGDDKTKGTGKVQSQAAATGLGAAIAASFTELQRQGVPLLDILKQFQPTIEAFRKQLQKTGFDGGAAFDAILKDADLLKDKTAGPALQSIQSLQQVLAGLANTGGLNAEIFSGLTDQIGRTFETLVAQGKDADQILRLMAPSLQTIFELQERTGFAVDETTQNLINQAKAQGLVGDQFKSSGERTVDGLDRVAQILTAIADKLGAKLPDAAKKGADGVNKALDGIKDKDITITGKLVIRRDFPGKDNGGVVVDTAATGGLVTASGIQRFASGGRVLPFKKSFGTDTVPAMLTPGEMVLNKMQQGAISTLLANASTAKQPVVVQLVANRKVLAELVLDDIYSGNTRAKFDALQRRAG